MHISKLYLLAYNTLGAILWLRILLTLCFLALSHPSASTLPLPTTIYTTLEPQTRWAQTLAVADVLHAAAGITRAPVFTTFTQVFARSVQVWAINYGFPGVTGPSGAYACMLLAWSVADAVRYVYFVALLSGSGFETGVVRWLRYSLFIVLYPVGIASEWWLMYGAATTTQRGAVSGVFYFCLGLYVPGSVMMYSYMIKQRRKVLA
ncbi:PTPLA-domain-containing protein [Aspergillus steynii IBT 23096]|uniref:Very-long-chain (3R)-3-hydroxyacyl-CoA dehydratase n=1 Tax=Aspergillus steynii IBT 23096 TaxID=1392250 RepID=A0A2I2GJJ2_9EURO|nr:PTPLA-domain-containing protein [Aspergillus steynii IBT 23096]PLB53046.1 PTPLA-domain-containing protein [Aspergillus steynii IBT 23096]